MWFVLGGSKSSGDNVVTPKSFTRVILETHTVGCKSGNEDSVETDPLYRQKCVGSKYSTHPNIITRLPKLCRNWKSARVII